MVQPFRDDESSLKLPELCHRAGVSPSTGHRWRLKRSLECYRLGGHWRVTREAWDRFIAGCNPPSGESSEQEGSRSSYGGSERFKAVKAELAAAGF